MESLENQVSEFRYLIQNPITPLPDTPCLATSQAHSSPGSVSAVGNNSAQHHQQHLNPTIGDRSEGNSSAKRKNVDDSAHAKQQKSKRNRYISIACNECKRRKIKCNGETPCKRCGNLNLQCLYAPNCCANSVKDSEDFKQMASTIARLQEQVETLFSNMSALRSETLRLVPIQDRALSLPSAGAPRAGTPSSPASVPSVYRADLGPLRQTSFQGPTSTHFTLNVAKNTLHKMGYSNLRDTAEENAMQEEDIPAPSPMLALQTMERRTPLDPLWDFDKDEMVRLCRLHEDEVGIMYPVVRIDTMINHAKALSAWMETSKKNGLVPNGLDQDGGFSDVHTMLLKMVMSCALVVEEHGHSEKATRLVESILPDVNRMLMTDSADAMNIPLLVFVGGYRFLTNDEVQAWRVMGQVIRYCLELGLHRRDTINEIADEEVRRNAICSFWTAYVLDRRWSFGTGLPYAMPDEEIDPTLPYPDSFPYLVAMISFSQLGANVWRQVRRFEPNSTIELRSSDIEDLDQQIKQWYMQVPAEIQLDLPDWDGMPQCLNPPVNWQKEYDIQRLQIWTYLRMNQMRIWLYTPILHTHSSIMDSLPEAERVVKLACSTIKYLTHLNNTTNLYRKLQVFYNQFLSSAIAVLFLASCHAPINFSSKCRDEFYMALELVKDLSSKSWVSKRLWRTIKSLKEVAPRLGLAEDPHSSAALTMAGLATGHMGPTSTPSPNAITAARSFSPPPVPVTSSAPHNGLQISTEMSKIFEGYLGMNGFDEPIPAVEDGGPFEGAPGGVTSVYQHFREMF